jgi:hypothetical protein
VGLTGQEDQRHEHGHRQQGGLVVASLGARGGGSLGRGMQASGDWANLPTATGPIAAVPCPRLHVPGSQWDWSAICRLPATGLSQETAGVQ